MTVGRAEICYLMAACLAAMTVLGIILRFMDGAALAGLLSLLFGSWGVFYDLRRS